MDRTRTRLAGQTARLFDRSPSWLKKLEAAGILPVAARDHGGRRIYSDADIEEIRRRVERRARERAVA